MENKIIEPLPFHVTGSNIFVEFLKYDNVTQSGIIIEDSKDRPYEAVIIGTGPHVIDYKIGDEVVVKKHEAQSFKIGKDEREVFLLKNDDSIVGVLE